MEPLALLERRLQPELSGTRQNALSERQDAVYVEFVKFGGVSVHPHQRQFLAELLGVAIVRVDIDGAFKQKRLVQSIELVLHGLRTPLNGSQVCAH